MQQPCNQDLLKKTLKNSATQKQANTETKAVTIAAHSKLNKVFNQVIGSTVMVIMVDFA